MLVSTKVLTERSLPALSRLRGRRREEIRHRGFPPGTVGPEAAAAGHGGYEEVPELVPRNGLRQAAYGFRLTCGTLSRIRAGDLVRNCCHRASSTL